MPSHRLQGIVQCAPNPTVSIPPPAPEPATAENAQWFTAEVQPHDSALKDYVRRAFPTLLDVEDVVQESYLRLWKRRAIEPIRSARAFLFRSAQRIAVDGLRRCKRSPVECVDNLAAFNVPDDALAAPESLDLDEKIVLLIEVIDALPARCREVVVLRKLKSLSQRETATRLGISEKGVEVQLARGMERCRQLLRKRGAEHFFQDVC